MERVSGVIKNLDSRDLSVRIEENLRAAEQWLAKDKSDLAAVCLRRAFELSKHAAEISDKLAAVLTELGQYREARAVLQAGMQQATRSGDLDKIVNAYRRWQYYTTLTLGVEDYRFDFAALTDMETAVSDIKEDLSNIVVHRDAEIASPRPKIVYIGTNLAQVGSVLAKVLLSMLKAHDASVFEFGLVFTDDEKKLRATEETVALINSAEDRGWTLFLEADTTVTGRVTKLSRRIREWQPDLLVTNCALASAEGLLLSAAIPHVARCSLVVGPPPLFAAPNADFVIASDERLLMECPTDGIVIPVETALPQRGDIMPVSRSEMAIAEDAKVIVAAGRYTKFSEEYCATLAKILIGHESAILLVLGVPELEKANFLARFPDELVENIRVVPWGRKYIEYLAVGDLLVDTFPSGGGVTVQDAMALEIPSICVGDDLTRPYRSDHWSVAYKFALPELVVELGQESRIIDLAIRCLSDRAFYIGLKERCREHVLKLRGRPDRMTKLHEDVYRHLLTQD
ncbi:hypothetical protein [Kordiimonas sp.]|uniref:hypothetical protein n=1 Tax=Kordiimonas sp. TaxID=1970157 RepID=UPI003A8CB06B